MMRESEIESYLVERVKSLGGEVRKVRWIGRRGAPDRVVMLARGIPHLFGANLVWVELKAPGKVAEPHQVREHARMRDMGQRVLIIDSKEKIDEVFK